MRTNYATVPVLTTDTIVFQWKYFFVYMREVFKVVVSRLFDKITVQSDTYQELIHENKNPTLAYVRVDEFDNQLYKKYFFHLLGG